MQIFGFSIEKKSKEIEAIFPSIVAPETDDGTQVSESSLAASYSYFLDLDGNVKTELESITTYREISLFPEVDEAIQDIVNEAIPHEEDSALVELVTDRLDDFSDSIKTKITDEFDEILKILAFSSKASDIFRRWYIDGRLYYNVVVDEKNPQMGIQELRPIEATKIKKNVEYIKQKDKKEANIDVIIGKKEYYVYSDKGFVATNKQNSPQLSTTGGVRLTKDSVIFVPSGFNDSNAGTVLGYLHKAIRPANQLRMLEDAVVIYRWSRAPERRIFYIDVGNLPKAKAEQYVKDIMNRYRNKITYDAKTGVIRDDKKYLSMMEDFWMPRRDGSKGTEITNLEGGQNLGELSDVEYFQKKLYQSLNIPISRAMPETGFNIGRSIEVTRDEVKFQKFINRLRRKFTELFFELLKRQLILKKIINDDEWLDIRENISFRFQKDNFFAELKNQEIIKERMMILQQADLLLGKYFSVEYMNKNILKFSDEEIKEMQEQMDKELAEHPAWFPMISQFNQQQEMAQQQQDMQMQQQEAGMQQQQSNQFYQQQNQDNQSAQDETKAQLLKQKPGVKK